MSDSLSMPASGGAGDVRAAGPGAGRAARPAAAAGARSRIGWTVYLSVMLLLGVYQGINQAIGNPQLAPWKPFSWEMSSVVMWILLLPLVMHLEQRIRVDSRPRWRALAVHLAGAVAVSVSHITGMVLLRKGVYALAGTVYEWSFHSTLLADGVYELQKDLITYALALVVLFAAREFRIRRVGELRAAELAAQLTSARLAHLSAQIEPHFLFNSLNAISNRMHEDVEAADRMISRLGDLLRAVYEADDQPLVPLGKELAWLSSYAAMMSERFRGQLSFRIEADPGLEPVRVPRLLLQPLVENAIRHGLGEGHGQLTIEVRRAGAHLSCTVSDDGAGLPPGGAVPGTGLANIARRLELLFPQAHSLEILPRQPRGTQVRVSFPLTP
jgi:signal transduction histidine kinase